MKPRPDLPPGPYLVVGLARSGIAVAEALNGRGEEVIGVDGGTPSGLEKLRSAGIELYLDEQGEALLERVQTVVKSPGVPHSAPVIGRARARGMCVLGELELAWRMLPNEFIAVTGTNGKTTTVELIGHIYREAGLPVAVAGNVGVALSSLVGAVDGGVTVVCEASSFQLEDSLEFAPEVAVLLNLTPDHLNRHGSLAAYREAKLRIFAGQQAEEVAVTPLDFEPEAIPGRARRVCFGRRPGAGPAKEGEAVLASEGVLYWRGEVLLAESELRLRGRHNVDNAMAAGAVCLARGLDVEVVQAGLRSFAGVPHRLEQVAERDGVLFVNDSKATNVASTLVALEAMAGEHLPVHLILGGQGKAQDFKALREPIERGCRAVYLIGEDAGKIEQAVCDREFESHVYGDLESALLAAAAAAVRGEVVLLSPGCASFDQFVDFEARGERFRELVLGL